VLYHCRRIWKGIGVPEFDIARGTLNVIYNQTLFIVGFYFSPLLALVVVLKMFITFYIRKVRYCPLAVPMDHMCSLYVMVTHSFLGRNSWRRRRHSEMLEPLCYTVHCVVCKALMLNVVGACIRSNGGTYW